MKCEVFEIIYAIALLRIKKIHDLLLKWALQTGSLPPKRASHLVQLSRLEVFLDRLQCRKNLRMCCIVTAEENKREKMGS